MSQESPLYKSGLDIIFTEPGECDRLSCRICWSECNVYRNSTGARCFAEAIGIGLSRGKCKPRPHDVFSCPHAGKRWHDKASELAERIFETRSKRVKKLMIGDLMDVLGEHFPKKHLVRARKELSAYLAEAEKMREEAAD